MLNNIEFSVATIEFVGLLQSIKKFVNRTGNFIGLLWKIAIYKISLFTSAYRKNCLIKFLVFGSKLYIQEVPLKFQKLFTFFFLNNFEPL